jgi:hypothetical protein
VKFSVRTANLYMQIADLPTELSQRVANLPLRDAINAALRKKEFKRSVEYYTESSCIEAARRVMGEIDLDPASCETAQHVAPYSISGRTTT